MTRNQTILGFVLLCFALTSAVAYALPAGFTDELVFGGLQRPTAVRFAPTGEVFVAEQDGIVYSYSSVNDPVPVITVDLTSKVNGNNDRGLLGLAVDPQYPNRPYLYVMYTMRGPNGENPEGIGNGAPSGRIERLTLNPATGIMIPNSNKTLVTDWCQMSVTHAVGDLQFGPDGFLYASAGEGASDDLDANGNPDYGQFYNGSTVNFDFNGVQQTITFPDLEATCPSPMFEGGAMRSQDLSTAGDPVILSGAIIRIDPDTGAAAPSNPRISASDQNEQRIIAYGLRNPYRFTIDQGNATKTGGEVFIADTGFYLWEEINYIPSATDNVVENFGWPCYEGYGPQPDFLRQNNPVCQTLYATEPIGAPSNEPFKAFFHGPIGGASTGITLYRSNASARFPDEYDGALFYADYVRAFDQPGRPTILVAKRLPNGALNVSDAPFEDFSDPVFAVDIQVGPDGALYYANFDRINAANNAIRRITWNSPVARITSDVTSGSSPLTVNFDATTSSDPAGNGLSYAWDLDSDGAYDDSTSATPQYTYTAGGNTVVRLRVTDSNARSSTTSIIISVGNTPPIATILSPANSSTFRVGDVIQLSGIGTDAESGTLPDGALTWVVNFRHCYTPTSCHFHPITTLSGTNPTYTVTQGHELPSFLEFVLTATETPSNWWDAQWNMRQRMTIDTTGITQTLSDFPVLVSIDNTANAYGTLSADGADIRFVADDNTPLLYQIDEWNPTGVSSVWVKMPTIPAAPTSAGIWMYYDNPLASDAQSTQSLWGAEYEFIYHMSVNSTSPICYKGETGYGVLDSSTKRRLGVLSDGQPANCTGNPVGVAPTGGTEVPGKIGNAISFDPSVDFASVVADFKDNLTTTSWTVSLWVKSNTPTASCTEAVDENGDGQFTEGEQSNAIFIKDFDYRVYFKESCKLGFITRRAANDPNNAVFGTSDVNLFEIGNTDDLGWHHVVYTYDQPTSTVRAYVDGVLGVQYPFGDATPAVNTTQTSVHPNQFRFQIGGNHLPGYTVDGTVDEVRLASAARSASWALADYKSGADTLLVKSAPESKTSANNGQTLLTASDSIYLYPETTELTLASNIPGAIMSVAQNSGAAPYVTTAMVGDLLSITAAQSVVSGGTTYVFQSWSDGGANPHTIAAPVADTTITANYVPAGAVLVVDTTPGGVSVFAAGNLLGTSDANGDAQFPLTPGGYVLDFVKAGYLSNSSVPVFLDPQETQTVQATLYPNSTMNVTSSVAGATIVIDGVSTDVVTPAVVAIGPGNYTVTVTLSGFSTASQAVEVPENANVDVSFTMSAVTPPRSGGGGGGGGGGRRVPRVTNSTNSTNSTTSSSSANTCAPSWSCGDWSVCSPAGTQTRVCSDANACGSTTGRPAQERACEVSTVDQQSGSTTQSGGTQTTGVPGITGQVTGNVDASSRGSPWWAIVSVVLLVGAVLAAVLGMSKKRK